MEIFEPGSNDFKREVCRVVFEEGKHIRAVSENYELTFCVICLEPFENLQEVGIVQLHLCKNHFFHEVCAYAMLENNGGRCAICSQIYIHSKGYMPTGEMLYSIYPPGKIPLAGHESIGTIVIEYSFRNGIQTDGMPSPGFRYTGTNRVAYLPDDEEGQDILRLLVECFRMKKTFVVGTSITTGQENTVVWNGIHHKTAVHGGPTNFGYPDGTYYKRVKEELAAKGIV